MYEACGYEIRLFKKIKNTDYGTNLESWPWLRGKTGSNINRSINKQNIKYKTERVTSNSPEWPLWGEREWIVETKLSSVFYLD